MAFQDREADGAQRLPQLLREGPLVGLAALDESPDVTRVDLESFVEGFLVIRLGEVVLLAFLDLVVTAVGLVRDLDAQGFSVG